MIGVCEWLNTNNPQLKEIQLRYLSFSLKMFDNHSNNLINIECKELIKYLGVIVDGTLTWKYHNDNIASKISKTIGIITRLRYFVPLSTLQNIYRCLILPYITYGI